MVLGVYEGGVCLPSPWQEQQQEQQWPAEASAANRPGRKKDGQEQESVSERPTIHESLRGSTCVQQYTLLLPHTLFCQQENYTCASGLKPVYNSSVVVLWPSVAMPSYVFCAPSPSTALRRGKKHSGGRVKSACKQETCTWGMLVCVCGVATDNTSHEKDYRVRFCLPESKRVGCASF